MHDFKIKELSPKAFEELRKEEELIIIDVREDFELDICKIDGSKHIKMGEIPHRLEEIPKDKKIVLLCHHGRRSKQVANFLLKQAYDADKIFNLTGGIHAYSCDVDSSLKIYWFF